MIVGGYGRFARLAQSLQWDEAAVSLEADREAWPALDEGSRRDVLGLVAGFVVGEAAVAEQLAPFRAAAADPRMAACFGAQAVDEARHARFFDRVAAEVAGVPGDGDDARRAHLRGVVGPAFLELFEERLPEAARALAEGRKDLAAAVALYHLVLEGVVFLAGQHALLRTLERATVELPGLRRGLELVLRDERWHIGFGARCLADGGLSEEQVRRLLAEGEAAAGAWAELVPPDAVAEAALLHRRRLRAAGLTRREAAA